MVGPGRGHCGAKRLRGQSHITPKIDETVLFSWAALTVTLKYNQAMCTSETGPVCQQSPHCARQLARCRARSAVPRRLPPLRGQCTPPAPLRGGRCARARGRRAARRHPRPPQPFSWRSRSRSRSRPARRPPRRSATTMPTATGKHAPPRTAEERARPLARERLRARARLKNVAALLRSLAPPPRAILRAYSASKGRGRL